MVQSTDPELDGIFAALADSTRRDMLTALQSDDFSLSEFASRRGMSLTGLMKHVRVLESAGLIERAKQGRIVRCELSAGPLQEAAVWLSRYEKFWTTRLDALGRYLSHHEEIEPCPPPTPVTSPRSSSSAATPSPRRKSGTPGPTRKR